MSALSAASEVMQGVIVPEDIVQVSTGARAILGNTGLINGCYHIGAMVYLAGQIDPEQALALLTEERRVAGKKPRTSVLSAYPSYLGQLVETGLRLGYKPRDFGLERIFSGGEIVTEGLRNRWRELFGDVRYIGSYGMTETIPFVGTVCSDGHMHFEATPGMLEVLSTDTGAPAGPGEAGTMVATPFMPYRYTTVLLRYDTQDVVMPIAGPLTCSMRTHQATTELLGKLRLSVRHDDGWTYPRDVLEALEAVDEVPLPARCGFSAAQGGVAVEVVVREDTPQARRTIGESLEARGVPVRDLRLVDDPADLRQPFPLRCDLRELSFSVPAGAREEGTE